MIDEVFKGWLEVAASEDDAGGEGEDTEGSSHGEDQVPEGEDEPGINPAQFYKEQYESAMERLERLQGEHAELLRSLRQAQQPPEDGGDRGKSEPESDPFEQIEWDNISSFKDFGYVFARKILPTIAKEFRSYVDKHVSELKDEVGESKKQSETLSLQQQISLVASTYPDYWNYRNEMIRIADERPHLDPEEVYALAKLRASKVRPRMPSTQRNEKGGTKPSGMSPKDTKQVRFTNFEEAFEDAVRKAGIEF